MPSIRWIVEPETLFKALADRTRQRTLALLTRQELAVSELVEILRQPQSTISRHLKVLRQAGLIRDRRNKSTVLYSLVSNAAGCDDPDLRGRVLEWVSDSGLTPVLTERLHAVIGRRRDMSDRFFDRIGRQWDALREETFGGRFHLEAFLALMPPDWTVADVGTGTGYLLPALAGHFEKVIAVDPVATMLDVARQRVSVSAADNVELRCGDLSQLPIADASVDLAVAMLVLHHVPAPRDAVCELRRIVRRGGRVLIVEQSAHENDSFRERMQDRWWGFEPQQLARLFTDAGFESVRSHLLTTVERAADAPRLFGLTAWVEVNDLNDRS